MKWREILIGLIGLILLSCTSITASAEIPYRHSPVGETEFSPLPTGRIASGVVSVKPATTPQPTSGASPVGTPTGKETTGKNLTSGTRTVIRGEASWGYGFYGHVVTRYPRGTIIRVCGKLGCTGRVKSWGYGPAKRTGRIADLDINVFRNVCGDPIRLGVCQIRLEVWR